VDIMEVREQIGAALQGAFLDENAGRARRPGALSLSGLGGCGRAGAYALAGTDPSDDPEPDEARAATLGTYAHDGLLPRMAARIPGAVFETPVVLNAFGVRIPGTLDLAWAGVMLDLKTVGERRLHGVRRRVGPYRDHWLQVMGYALARHQAGHPVRWVAWLYLDRATGDHEIMVEEFTNRAALAVLDRVRRLQAWAAEPDKAPREGRGPGVSLACDGCAWLRRCWGPSAVARRKGTQTAVAHDVPAVERLLELLDDASRRRGEAGRDYEFAKLALAATPKGTYGQWSLRRDKRDSPLVRLTSALSPAQRRDLDAKLADDEPD
jgi:hypothetical protein